MMKFCIQAHSTLNKTLKQQTNGFNLGCLPKHKCKVFFIAIPKTTRARETITKTLHNMKIWF